MGCALLQKWGYMCLRVIALRYRYVRTAEEGQISTKAADEGGAVTAGRVPDIVVQANVEYRTTTVTPRRTTEASTDITTITIIRVIIIIIVDGD